MAGVEVYGSIIPICAIKAGRVRVQPDCSVPGHPEVFVIGDTASLEQDGTPLPGVAQVAMQQGRFVGNVITQGETGCATPPPFRYVDKGNMAVIGRGFAILDAGIVKLSGFPAWLVWAFIHIAFLPTPETGGELDTGDMAVLHPSAQFVAHRGAAR